MCEADAILRQFGARLQQIRLSLFNSQGGHESLNYESMLAFRRVSHLLSRDVPIILGTLRLRRGFKENSKKSAG